MDGNQGESGNLVCTVLAGLGLASAGYVGHSQDLGGHGPTMILSLSLSALEGCVKGTASRHASEGDPHQSG